MKRVTCGAILAAAMVVAGEASAFELKMFPYRDPDWDPEFNLAITAGQFDPQVSGASSESAIGLQLGLNCPWFGPPVGKLRQQFNYNVVDGDGVDVTTFEVNPRWYEESGALRYGFGPGFGYMWVSPDFPGADDETSFTLQLSVAAEYRFGKFFVGAGTRYQYTMNQDMYGSGDGMDNLLTDLKVGLDF